MLTFDEAEHRYYWNGEPVPNVTSILSGLTDYSRIAPAVLEEARQKGVAVHKMVELDCANDLDVDTLPDWMRGHYQAWQRFREETGFECWASEHKLYHPKLRYAGTLDLVGLLPKTKIKGLALLDVKRSFYAGPVIGLQTAAYLDAWNRTEEKASRLTDANRYALRLDGDGKYRLEPFNDPGDIAVFVANLTLYRWRMKHERTR